MESDWKFIVKLIQRLSGDMIYRVFSIKTTDNVQTNFITLYTVSMQSPY